MTSEGNGANSTTIEKMPQKEKHIVKVPVSVTIIIPMEMDLDVPDDNSRESDEMDCTVVNITEYPDIVNDAIANAMRDDCATKAFEGLLSAAMRFRDYFPQCDIYITPYAGLIPEQKL